MPKADYNYHLPEELIAQIPSSPRDSSKLMVIDRKTGTASHRIFRDLPDILLSSDVLVFNDTKVFPARLRGYKSTGGKVEVLLLKNTIKNLWEVISHPGLKVGQNLLLGDRLQAVVISPDLIELKTSNPNHSVSDLIYQAGSTPLPPYIHSTAPENKLRRQYQTVYAKFEGSAAAPTAGLHFTKDLIERLLNLKFQLEYLTLHVGLGTFKPPTPDQIAAGALHSESFTLESDVADRLNQAKSQGRRIVAVGTTTTRVLETLSNETGHLNSGSGTTNIFIKPQYKFKFVDGLITNFHLPESSLLMLVSAFASPKIIEGAYKDAIKNRYRFYSFGDATLII